MFTKQMQDALRADAEKLRHLTGEEHNVVFLDDADDPVFVSTCEPCSGTGTILKAHPFPEDPEFCADHLCGDCGGSGRIFR